MNSTYYIKVILKRKFLIAFICLVSAAATFSSLNYKNKEYISRAQLATGITNNEEVSISQVETNWNIINNKFNNFIEFMNAKEIYSNLTYKLILYDLTSPTPFRPLEITQLKKRLSPEQANRINEILHFKYDSMEVLFLDKKDEAFVFNLIKQMKYDIKSIKKALTLSRIPNTDFIKLECKSENPKLSAFIVNTYSEETIRFYKYRETTRRGSSVSFFEELVKKKKEDLDRKVDTLEKFKTSSQLIDYKSQSQSKLDHIAALEQSKSDETQKIASIQNAIKQIDRQLNSKDKENYESKTVNEDITRLQNKISVLNKNLVSSGMSDSKIADSIRVLKSKLDFQVDKFSRETFGGTFKEDLLAKKLNYEIDLSMAQASLAYIMVTMNSLKSEVSTLAVNEPKLAELEMAVSVAKDEYLAIVNKYNTAKNISLVDTENLRQIEFAQPADEPEPSKRILFTALSGIATLFLTLTFIILLVYLDNSVKTPEMLMRSTNLPMLGYLSFLKIGRKDILTLLTQEKAKKSLIRYKEELRKIRFEMEKSGAKTFLFTSTKESEGKSFALFSIAYSMNLNNKKVLIIDTNFKNNTLSRVIKGNENLENYLLNEKNDSSFIIGENVEDSDTAGHDKRDESILSQTSVKGIDIIRCKGTSLSPSEIFQGKSFKKLLDSYTVKYDYILMEGAALNTYSDTKELLEYADKMIAVFSARSTIREVDKPSIAFLANHKDKFLGALLNKIDAENLEL